MTWFGWEPLEGEDLLDTAATVAGAADRYLRHRLEGDRDTTEAWLRIASWPIGCKSRVLGSPQRTSSGRKGGLFSRSRSLTICMRYRDIQREHEATTHNPDLVITDTMKVREGSNTVRPSRSSRTGPGTVGTAAAATSAPALAAPSAVAKVVP